MVYGIVYGIPVPDVLIEVDVPYEHAVAGQHAVESCPLSVLEKEELRRFFSIGDVCFIAFAKFVDGVFFCFAEFFRFDPSEREAFERRIQRRYAAVAVVGSTVERCPRAGCVCVVVYRGVQVRNTHYVAEFMYERTYSDCGFWFGGVYSTQLIGACIMVYEHSVHYAFFPCG